jgi:hypothetical protein
MWRDEGVWIALGVSALFVVGVSALFVVVGAVMHRVFVRILKTGADASDREKQHE